jgi:hypothetical protein
MTADIEYDEILDGLFHNADSRIMPTGVRRVTRDPANRTGTWLPDAA